MVSPTFPAGTFTEYVAFAKANPGKISLGTSGQGGVKHLMKVCMHTLTDTTATNIPYKGSAPMLVDLLGGRLDGAAIPIGDAMRCDGDRAVEVGGGERDYGAVVGVRPAEKDSAF